MHIKILLACVIAFQLFGMLLVINSVGKPRKPITGGIAASATIFSVIEITILWYTISQI